MNKNEDSRSPNQGDAHTITDYGDAVKTNINDGSITGSTAANYDGGASLASYADTKLKNAALGRVNDMIKGHRERVVKKSK